MVGQRAVVTGLDYNDPVTAVPEGKLISLPFFGDLFWDVIHRRPFLFLFFSFPPGIEKGRGEHFVYFIFDFVPSTLVLLDCSNGRRVEATF